MTQGRRWWPCVAIVGLALAGCALPVDDHARALDAEKLPAALAATSSPTTTVALPGGSPSTTQRQSTPDRVWFIAGDQLQSVPREVFGSPSGLIDALLAGPSPEEVDGSGLRSAIPEAAIISTDIRGGVATLDLDPSFVAIPTGDQILAVGQLVLTLTGLPGVGQVRFAVDGTAVRVPRADGSQVDAAVSREDYLPLTQG